MSLMSFKAGTASIVITPSESMWMAGFAARRVASSGVELDLYAKALAIEDESGHRQIIITSDLIAISKEIADYVCSRSQEKFGLKREQILITSSHTHCGPEVRPSKVPFFHIPEEFARKIQPYVDELQEKIIAITGEALNDLEPVTLTAHQTATHFAANRRGHETWADKSVPILAVKKKDGSYKAVVFGYACHNTTLRPDYTKFNSDYCGYAQQELQKDFPGCQAMFIAGAGADQNPALIGSLEAVQAQGRLLAAEVRYALAGASASSGVVGAKATPWTKPEAAPGTSVVLSGPIRSALDYAMLQHQPLPPRAELESQSKSEQLEVRTKAKFLLDKLDSGHTFSPTYPCPLHAISFGDSLLMIAIAGEPVSDYAIMMKKEFQAPVVWIAGYANDMFGYVPTARVQKENGYEGGRAMLWAALPMPWTEGVEDRVMETARKVVQEIRK